MLPITGYNNLVLEVYAAFSTTRILDADNDLTRAQNLRFETMYPGGLFSVLTFSVIRDPNRSWLLKQGQRIVARNGLQVCWEGSIVTPGYSASGDLGMRTITAIGYWGVGLLGAVGQRKGWCDMRITDNVWPPYTTNNALQAGADKSGISRTGGVIRIVPKGEKWNANDHASIRYTMPTGQTVKRIKYSYDFSEDASMQPAVVIDFNGVATYTDLTNTYDGDTSTVSTVTITTAHFVYLGVNQSDADRIVAGQAVRLSVTMGSTKNAVVSTLSANYWSDTTGNWAALTITDGTASGGKTLAQTGVITFTKPGDMGGTALGDTNKTKKIWVRFAVSVNLTASINIAEITYGLTQDWYIAVYNSGLGAEIAATKVSATGTGSIDNTLATPSQSIEIYLYSNVQQTPFSNGSIYAQLSNIRVYADSNAITASEVVSDWASTLNSASNLNADVTNIASNTLAVEPWITGTNLEYEMAASNLSRIAALGDASFNPWAAYVLESERAAAYDGKPVLAYQQQPALTDYDYAISLDGPTLESLALSQTQILNDIIVSYTDANGVQNWLTSADDSGLTDATSVSTYGKAQSVQNMGRVSSTVAAGLGKRFLAQNKDVHFYVNGSIPVRGYILTKAGLPVPVSEVRAGKRIKVLNFLTDEVGASGAGLTFIISHTAYDDDTETLTIDCSVPDNLAVFLARIAAFGDKGNGLRQWQQF